MPEVTYSFPTCRTPGCRTLAQPGYADRGLCDPCEQRGIEALQALPADHLELLPLVWEKQSGGLGPSGPNGFEPSEPVNLATDALVREIEYAVRQWHEIVRDRAGLPVAERVYGITDCCRQLEAFYSALIAVPEWSVCSYPDRGVTTMDGPGAVVWMSKLHRRARIRIGIVELVMELPGKCQECGWPSLRHRDTRDTVWCDHCRESWTWDDYQEILATSVWGATV
jgi:hypothetical protein